MFSHHLLSSNLRERIPVSRDENTNITEEANVHFPPLSHVLGAVSSDLQEGDHESLSQPGFLVTEEGCGLKGSVLHPCPCLALRFSRRASVIACLYAAQFFEG